ncbi:MAG: exodeoxyribonuclease VII small subunit [Actinomycetota bacterium]|nr:exodeoxyribonuclease VII small subunit [Actinomycetota bacterium]
MADPGPDDDPGTSTDGAAADGAGGAGATDATIGYTDAIAELDEILAELEGDTVDVDRLAGLVERGSALIGLCRQRIRSARVHVERVVADLDRLPGLDVPAPGRSEADDDDAIGDDEEGLLPQVERRSDDN